METLFIGIYRFFQTRKPLLWIVFTILTLLIVVGACQIKLEEDITKIFPDDERSRELSFVFSNSKFVDRLVIMVSVKDSATSVGTDQLALVADEMAEQIEQELSPHVSQVVTRIDDSRLMEVFSLVREYLPVFLTEDDYASLDSLTGPETIENVLHEQFRQLISPVGLVTKKIIMNDPLGFSYLVLRKLQDLQYDDNFLLYDNYIITKDKRHLLFFVQPAYEPNDTKNNFLLIDGLNDAIGEISAKHSDVLISYFGSSAVAVGNARQLRSDTLLTISLTVGLLAVFIVSFFKRKRVLFLIFIPVLFGALFSLCCIFLLKGTVSILAVAAGSVVLGIAVNYSLHFLVHLKYTGETEAVIRDLIRPMTLGSATTVLAFLCLQFVNASVLRDVGLFAAFSLIGAALCSLIFLPHFIQSGLFQHDQRPNWVERFTRISVGLKNYAVIIILLLTPVFFYFAGQVGFNSDMNKLNFMHPVVSEAGKRLDVISKSSQGAVYIVSTGNDLEEAFRKTEKIIPVLDALKSSGVVSRYTSVSGFLISDSLQRERINRWNKYWTNERKEQVLAEVRRAGKELRFSSVVFENLDTLLSKKYHLASQETLGPFRQAFLDDYIIEKDGKATVITLANVTGRDRPELYRQFEHIQAKAFDRQMLTNLFVEYVNADFNFIVTFTAILVFVALLISYGRIEITLIAFVPMLITWIWILGMMALLGIEFNIVNVMISTFIFGLGDDYSIFIMDGLQQEYKLRKKSLPSIRTSIFLSALTTICGLGVLIFAQHPALRSVAAIAIIGIASVFVMAQTVEPFLFRWLISNRTKKGLAPMTFRGILMTLWTYGFFVLGSFMLTIIGVIFKLIPFGKVKVRLFFHYLIRLFTAALIYVAFNVKKRVINKTSETFSRPNVLVSNHSSFLDILFMAMLHPKIILLTNKWVWNSPVFGGVVRLADYYPVMEGAESGVERLRERVEEGYSVAVFPEGTRSPDGKIGRFHKGAFYLAELLNLPVTPVLIHGSSDGIRKNEIYLNNTTITVKFLPPILPSDKSFGETYSERTKNISHYFKQEHRQLALQQETNDYFRHRLITNFIYKGPVLEWYLRIKLRLEKNYEVFYRLVPRQAEILDLGCGYGFLCYMLQFLSNERRITGVDYDEEKIETARHAYSKTDRLSFACHDITTYELGKYDVIIMNDVLHYLSAEQQVMMLQKTFSALNPGGRVIIREGNTEHKDKHGWTRLSEFFSVQVLQFNKSQNKLHFMSGETIRKEAAQRNLTVTELDDSKYTSNVIFVVAK